MLWHDRCDDCKCCPYQQCCSLLSVLSNQGASKCPESTSTHFQLCNTNDLLEQLSNGVVTLWFVFCVHKCKFHALLSSHEVSWHINMHVGIMAPPYFRLVHDLSTKVNGSQLKMN